MTTAETPPRPTSSSSIQALKPLEVKQATELAQYYHVPPSLMSTFAVQFGDTLYWKEPFLLERAHQRGLQRIEVDKPVNENGESTTEARIYPKITAAMIEAIAKLPEAERKEAWAYMTAPTREWGRASTSNVRMSTMHAWLPEIAIKRAVCRALRLFCGIGQTSFEELPDVVVDKRDLEEVRRHVISDEKPKPSAQPTRQSTTMSLTDNTPNRSSQQ
jgi:hypothetical protein